MVKIARIAILTLWVAPCNLTEQTFESHLNGCAFGGNTPRLKKVPPQMRLSQVAALADASPVYGAVVGSCLHERRSRCAICCGSQGPAKATHNVCGRRALRAANRRERKNHVFSVCVFRPRFRQPFVASTCRRQRRPDCLWQTAVGIGAGLAAGFEPRAPRAFGSCRKGLTSMGPPADVRAGFLSRRHEPGLLRRW